jgi:2-polyprenyl-3-methyl-5-hydroxy-6-metoxy-1,4-benzoquinol methylase
MSEVSGTRGYEQVVDAFIRSSQVLSFADINEDFLPFLPPAPSRILDAGAGAGQNAAALARMGHSVVAVEPYPAFLHAAKAAYSNLEIDWIKDCLPKLERLGGPFDFILVDGVWHHLDTQEREEAMERFVSILAGGGVCAISLRNGPAGGGKHVFPTHAGETVFHAESLGLRVILHLADQPSKMKDKPDVIWSRVAFRKLTRTATP